MAQQPRPQRRVSPPSSNALPRGWEKEITEQFRQKLSTQRMAELSNRSGRDSDEAEHSTTYSRYGSGQRASRSRSPADDFALGASAPSSTGSSSLSNIPIVARPPTSDSHRRFRNQLHMLSETPCKWENPGLLDEAMNLIPLDKIYADADEENRLGQEAAMRAQRPAAWGRQDCVIRALLKWFKRSFFTWVNHPTCSQCESPTLGGKQVAPTQEENALGGRTVESYECSRCGHHERFPRYNDAFVLMRTRKGRQGEWVNCFSMFCRAVGSRVRWVWSSEDRLWVEVYSEYRKRWVHVDPCEAAFDRPLMYTEGWGLKFAYCIAFSADGAADVTRRYVRNPVKYGKTRKQCSEEVVLYIMDEIRAFRRRNMEKKEKFKLEGEDMRESRELRHYYFSTLAAEVAKLQPPPPQRMAQRDVSEEAIKAAELRAAAMARQEGVPEFARENVEDPVISRRGSDDRMDES